MSRPPLELTVHPPLKRPRYGDQIESYRKQWKREEKLRQEKRLTDSELAAEVNSAIFHEAECEVRGLRLGMHDPEHPGIEHWVDWNHEFGRRVTILERFAMLPHYDEAGADK